MTDRTPRLHNNYDNYHAHVYFNESTAEQANALCRRAGEKFGVTVGRFHKKRVGPHPEWSCQLSFGAKQFEGLIGWLEEQRDGLTVFVHCLSGNGLEDHTTHATFLGEPATLNLEMFRR